MISLKKLALIAVAVVALVTLAPSAHAQILSQKIEVTFSGPVEIPGQVLPAGSYIFDEIEPGHLTRIMNAQETHVYATLFTVPEERQDVERGDFVLEKNVEGAPERISAWFCPGDSVGSEFTYSESGPGSVLKEAGHKLKISVIFVGRETEHAIGKSIGAVAHAAEEL